MENNNNYARDYSYIIRRSPIVLIMRLLAAEMLILFLSLLLRIPALFIELQQTVINVISLYFIFIIVLQLLNFYLIFRIVLGWVNEYYILKPKEIIVRSGILSINEVAYRLANLQSITIEQNLIERFFNYGTIKLYNPVLKQEVYLYQIPNPKKYLAIIQSNPIESSSPMRRLRGNIF